MSVEGFGSNKRFLFKAVGQKQWGREGNFDTLFHCPVYGNYGSPDDKLTRPTRLSLFLFGVED